MDERKTQWLLPTIASAGVLIVAAITGPFGGEGIASGGITDKAVTATSSNRFQPAGVTVIPGETVTWTNGGGTHDVVFEDGYPPMDPSSMPWTFMRTFQTPDVYPYYCSVHRAEGMVGTVTVEAAAPPPGPPPPPGGSPPPGGGSPGGGSPGGGNPGPGGDPSSGSPSGGKLSIKVTLQVSDPTPEQGGQVRFFGSVQPEQDGRLLQLQRRTGAGSYRTIKKLKLRDAGTSRSKFGGTLRVSADAAFRARLPADSAHEPGTSRTRRLNVH